MIRRAFALVLAFAVLMPGVAGAQPAACERWRRVFATMPQRPVRVESGGRSALFTVRLADTIERQAGGFQCATADDIARTLILFDFGEEIRTAFHMQNVAAPLDIAFVKADGRIFSILTMRPSPTDVYGPLGDFRWALEAPAGFFARHGIRQGEARLVAGH